MFTTDWLTRKIWKSDNNVDAKSRRHLEGGREGKRKRRENGTDGEIVKWMTREQTSLDPGNKPREECWGQFRTGSFPGMSPFYRNISYLDIPINFLTATSCTCVCACVCVSVSFPKWQTPNSQEEEGTIRISEGSSEWVRVLKYRSSTSIEFI